MRGRGAESEETKAMGSLNRQEGWRLLNLLKWPQILKRRTVGKFTLEDEESEFNTDYKETMVSKMIFTPYV